VETMGYSRLGKEDDSNLGMSAGVELNSVEAVNA
jgi:hypothetical protein